MEQVRPVVARAIDLIVRAHAINGLGQTFDGYALHGDANRIAAAAAPR
jgi:hypothetical protein